MNQMIDVKTAELIGPALDWAVAKAEGYEPLVVPTGRAEYSVGVILAMDYGPRGFACRYSTDWAQGGPLIEKHKVSIAYHNGPDCTPMACLPDTHPAFECGATVLIAACRAIVAAKLGDTVRVPAALVGGEA